MLNRTVSNFLQSLMILGLVVSLSACGHFGIGGEDDGEKAVEQMEQSEEMAEEAMGEAEEAAEDMMESHADKCPHGGGACCEHEEPHPCCVHAAAEGGAESQPASQPAE